MTIQTKKATCLVFAILMALVVACGIEQTQSVPTVGKTTSATITKAGTSQVTATAVLSTQTQTPTATAEPPTRTQPPTATAKPTQTPLPTLGIGSTQISPKDGMVMLYVPAGSFLMGSDKAKDPQASPDEMPQHTVTLDSYWIDRTEVTNAIYALCVAAGSCTKPSTIRSYYHSSYYGNSQYADYPVISVTWSQVDSFCRWAGRRLPTEAEWEKASRGTDGRIYPWGNQASTCSLENFQDCNVDTNKVGSYPAGASPYGALDMSGNVWEWVADWYSATYYQNAPDNNPPGPAKGDHRVIRGGSWANLDVWITRSADRYWYKQVDSSQLVGFRCAASP